MLCNCNIINRNGLSKVCALSKDHKPSDNQEKDRIEKAGGSIYQYEFFKYRNSMSSPMNAKNCVLGPIRVSPGRLSVSRTFGDPEAKIPVLGGIPGVVCALPEIRAFKILPDYDFIILASDGIYDKLSNNDIMKCVSMTVNEADSTKTINEICSDSVECIAKNALNRKSLDNVSVLMLAFNNFKNFVNYKRRQSEHIIPKPISKKELANLETFHELVVQT